MSGSEMPGREHQTRRNVARLTAALALGLLAMGTLRHQAVVGGPLAGVGRYATLGYIAITAILAVRLLRVGLPLRALGFAARPELFHLLLAAGGVLLLQLHGHLLEPVLEAMLSGPRDLRRFADVSGSPGALIGLLFTSWTFAAFGEELAYRMVLMRGVACALGDGRHAVIAALLIQAAVFGLVHAYQGSTGIASSAIGGMVFGAIALAGRWAIWPSALAHGINNTIGILELYQT